MEKLIEWSHFDIDALDLDEPITNDETDKLPIIDFPSPVYNTIIGPIDVSSGQHILEHFNIWIMDVNFTLDEEMIYNISEIEGVELIRPISKYKCAIGFGKLFKHSDIKVLIEHLLTGKHKHYLELCSLEDPIRKNAIDIFSKISKYPHWIMYIFPNGNIEQFFTSDSSEFNDKLLQFNEYKELSNGLLIHD